MWVWLCISLVAVVRRVITPAIADNSSYKQRGGFGERIWLSSARILRTHLRSQSLPSQPLDHPRYANCALTAGKFWRLSRRLLRITPNWEAQIVDIEVGYDTKAWLNSSLFRRFPLRACRRGCNGRSLPCLRVSVVAALPSSPLPTAGLLGAVGVLPACLWGARRGGALTEDPPTTQPVERVPWPGGWGGERKGFTVGQISVVKCWLARVALPGSNRDYPSRRQTDSAIQKVHIPPTWCYVEICTRAIILPTLILCTTW